MEIQVIWQEAVSGKDDPQGEKTRQFIRRLKIFEATIDSKDYDFIGFGAELDKYLFQNDVSASAKNSIRMAVEETVQQMLLPKYAHPDIRVRVEYSIRDESCEITFDYAGEKYDIRESDNDISLAMLNNITDEIAYQYDEAGDMGNHASMRIRKK